jgi:hypothetical protein
VPYPVSQEYMDHMKAFYRRIYGRVVVDYTDPFLDQSIQTLVNEEANVSYHAQTADSVAEPFAKILSLDGSCKLDGTYRLAPRNAEEAATHQMGWWGKQLAGAGGAFTEPYPQLTVTHQPRPVHSIRVSGDSKRVEWPVDFTVRLYAQDETLLRMETVTGNTQVAWSMVLPVPVLDVAKQVLTITRWSHAGRQAKIVEFFTSIQEVYEGEAVIRIGLLEERDVSQGSLPIGNISANELRIVLDNSSRKFDAGNTQSPLYGVIRPNRRIRAYLGIKRADETMEYAPLGTFWSGDWDAPEDETQVSTTGRDRLGLLSKEQPISSEVQVNKTLKYLAEMVLQAAGLKPEEYWVDPELDLFVVPYAYFEPQAPREALRKIVEACLGQAYCDRDGVIRVEGPSFMASKTTSVLTITQDDYFRKNNPSKASELANYVEVETAPLRPDVSQEVYRSNEPVSIGAGEIQNLTVYYNQTPCIDAVASLAGAPSGCIIQNATYYASSAVITVYSPSNPGSFTLVIQAKPLKVLNKEIAVAKDDASITENGRIAFKLPGNPFLQTPAMAQTIADMALASFGNPRRDMEMEWAGNPALLLADRVTVVDRNEQNDYFVTRQEIDWTGALRARLSGRRVS